MRQVAALTFLLVMSSCAAPVPVPSASPHATGGYALPTEPPLELPTGAVAVCGGIALDARLHGNSTDPHVAWLISDLGTRVEVVWPAGYRARFNPLLEVVAPSGVVVLREGDLISGACTTGDPNTLLLEP
ncbi:MAG: hypothetical protein ACRDGQ_10225 [Candidatus Limnocylindrales bacterium]